MSKKRSKDEGEQGPAPAKVPERISSPFKDALGPLKKQLEAASKQAEEDRKAAKNKPLPPPRPVTRKAQKQLDDDGLALSLAMQGVKPLGGDRPGRVGATTPKVPTRTAQVVPFGRSAEDDARARLDALVAQDVSFRIEREGDWVQAVRAGAQPRVARELARRTRASETLDLHGMNQRLARDAVVSFVRGSHKRGISVLCVIHGKGQHSEDGIGVLRDVVIEALTQSAVANLVLAFASASEALGGAGALLIELKH
ncbi:MAG TPA: Smr/MutS family protein [Polyangiales bacterium]|nr:Smr/MutS family protein [Polyangiales bacterium]